MNRTERLHIHRFIASILLVIISLYYSSSTMFGHTHVINGATITHSHFHNNNHTQAPDGGHTSDELTLIRHLTLHEALSGEVAIFEVAELQVFAKYLAPADCFCVASESYDTSSPRAPPVL